MNLPILDISYKWNHTICGLLCLPSFTEHSVFKVHLCCSKYQNFIPFKKKILEYSWSTILCWFQMYSKVNQLYTYRYPLFFRFFFHIDHYRVGEGKGTPLQYSCLENPIDRGAWGAAVHGVAKSGHDCATSLSLFTFMHWRRKWQPTPVFLPGESQGWRSLLGFCLWGRTELDMTEVT